MIGVEEVRRLGALAHRLVGRRPGGGPGKSRGYYLAQGKAGWTALYAMMYNRLYTIMATVNGNGTMHKDLTISAARSRLTSLPEDFEKKPGAVAVTRNAKPVMAILPWELYESLTETIEIMGDPTLMAQLRAGIEDLRLGRIVSWERAKKELDL